MPQYIVYHDVQHFNYSESIDDVGDLYLDIAEAYMDQGYYAEAKPILASLVDSAKYNLVCILIYCIVYRTFDQTGLS